MGLRERMLEEPGSKGNVVQEPEFQVGDKVRINPANKRSLAIMELDIDSEAVYTVSKIRAYLHRSCRLDWDEEDGCASHCKHSEECLEADDEIYADWIIGQIITVNLSGVSRDGLGSTWFINA